MEKSEYINYWIESSDEDYDVMLSLYQTKKYTWCLFVGHLVIEKLIKGMYIKNNEENLNVPKIHNLLLLAQKAKIELSNEQEEVLLEFNSFNISARYEDYKRNFKEKCTR